MTRTADLGPRPLVEQVEVNGVRIACTDSAGPGPSVVMVHGSWGSHANWDAVAPGLAKECRVVTYDRRGHSDSGPAHGDLADDVADLAALIERLGLAPAWVVGNSYGSCVTVHLAAARTDLLSGIVVHEPPFMGLLADDEPAAASMAVLEAGPLAQVARRIASGDHAGAAELFIDEVALGPGTWAQLPGDLRSVFIGNAPTYLEELDDPTWRTVDPARLARVERPALVTSGQQSPAFFAPIADRVAELLPHAARSTYAGAGHVPHLTHSDEYVASVLAFVKDPDAIG